MENIHIAPYDPLWPAMFDKEAVRIKQALGDNCLMVHHIGSTAVKDLPAKPVIDIMPVVRDIIHVDSANAAMKALGYEAKGEHGMLFRRYFQKDIISPQEPRTRTHNVHVYEEGNPEIDRHIAFQNWLRCHDDEQKAYAVLKQNLAKQFPNDILAYCMGKESFVATIEAKAGCSGFRCVQALTNREWAAYHRIRQELLFADLPHVIYDPNHPTLTSENHFHFILYKGNDIVCVAGVAFLNEGEAALRSLATDMPYQKQGCGSHMLRLLERWIKHQGRHTIKMHARPYAEGFYRRLGYVDMTFDESSVQINPVNLGKKLIYER